VDRACRWWPADDGPGAVHGVGDPRHVHFIAQIHSWLYHAIAHTQHHLNWPGLIVSAADDYYNPPISDPLGPITRPRHTPRLPTHSVRHRHRCRCRVAVLQCYCMLASVQYSLVEGNIVVRVGLHSGHIYAHICSIGTTCLTAKAVTNQLEELGVSGGHLDTRCRRGIRKLCLIEIDGNHAGIGGQHNGSTAAKQIGRRNCVAREGR
jgi:hypothetical protein